MYYSAGLCWGILIDADTGLRAYMDDEILITRMLVIVSPIELNVANSQSGGGSKKDAQGGLVQMKDQDESTRGLAALLNSKNTQTPVGIIIGLYNPPNDFRRR